jgi:Bacterial toxin 50
VQLCPTGGEKGNYQNFTNGNYTTNQIYWHSDSNKTHFTAGIIGKLYYEIGGTWSEFGFPTGDSYNGDGLTYCKQWFSKGKEIDLCKFRSEDPIAEWKGEYEPPEEKPDNLIEIGDLSSDDIDLSDIMGDIIGNLRSDFDYYFRLDKYCGWWNAQCHGDNASGIVSKIKSFLENLLKGLIKGLESVAKESAKEFQELLNNIGDLLKDPIKTVKEAVDKVKEIWNSLLGLLSNPSQLVKILIGGIDKFFDNDISKRIQALGSSIGKFAGERAIDSLQGVLQGGVFFGVAKVIKGIVDKAQEALKFVINKASILGKIIKQKISNFSFKFKSIGGRVGIDKNEILALPEPKKLLQLPEPSSESHKSFLNKKSIIDGDNANIIANFSKKIDSNKQDKHFPDSQTFKNLPIKKQSEYSILTIDKNRLTKLAEEKIGSGSLIIPNNVNAPVTKEIVNFGEKIGIYKLNGEIIGNTTKGTIHHSSGGYHVVPAKP